MYTSAQKRAILSLKSVREGLDQKEVPCSLMIQIHEKGGVHINKKTQTGLKRSEVLELLPDLQIDKDQAKLIDEDGWFKQNHVGTADEL